MCIVSLSVIKKFQHELATIDYCRCTRHDFPEDTNEAAIVSGEEPWPRTICTPLLGWSIFEALNTPVTCKSCKAWLAKNEKHTCGDMMEMLKDDQKDKVAPEQSVKRSRRSIVWTSEGLALPRSPATR